MQVNSAQEAKVNAAIAKAKSIDELKQILADYPNNSEVASMKIKLATLYFNKKDYAEALKVYQSILASNVPDELRWRARLNICYIQELEGQKEQAAAGFAAIASDSVVGDAFASEANYSAGRIFAELKKIEDARHKLEKAVASMRGQNPSSLFWGGQAKVLLDRLNASHPVAAPEKKTADKS
jgi:predicted negative regulator of RcsB-dependent stress response